MNTKINKLKEIVNQIYTKELIGIDFLRTEELFDKYFNEIRNLSRHTKEEKQELQCLEYEYEAYVSFKRQPYESIEESLMESFKYVAAAIYEHERMCELVGRIFEVGEPLISSQKDIFICNVKGCDIQKAWFLEAYGEEYVKLEKWGEAQKNYWQALDIYMAILKTEDIAKIRKCFYDGQAYSYICDVIYRIYGCIEKADDYETAIEYFRTREKEYMEITYFHKYYATILYIFANKIKSEKRKLYLEKCINVIDYANEKLQGIGLYDLKCGSLFLLEKYDEVNELCEKVLANKYYDEDKESILRYYIFVNIHRYINSWDKNNEGEEVEYLTKMAKHIDEISIDKMDAYKQYVPVISLYNKMNVNDKIRNNIIEGLFALLLQVNVIKNKLLYENDKQEFGYYTTLNSIKYLLEDDQENRMHRISVFDARHMNDPNEGKILIDFLNKDNNISSKETDRRRISYENEYVFLKSFTTKVDSLPMWVQYSDDGKGCFISVKSETFTEGQNLVYSKQEKEIREMLIEDEYQIYRVAYFDGQNFTTSDGICITEQIETWILGNVTRIPRHELPQTLDFSDFLPLFT